MDELSILRARVTVLERQMRQWNEVIKTLLPKPTEEEEDEEMEEPTPMAD